MATFVKCSQAIFSGKAGTWANYPINIEHVAQVSERIHDVGRYQLVFHLEPGSHLTWDYTNLTDRDFDYVRITGDEPEEAKSD